MTGTTYQFDTTDWNGYYNLIPTLSVCTPTATPTPTVTPGITSIVTVTNNTQQFSSASHTFITPSITTNTLYSFTIHGMDNVGGINNVVSATLDGRPIDISIQSGGGGAVSCIGWIRFTGTTGTKTVVITYNTLTNKSQVGVQRISSNTSDVPYTSAVNSNTGSPSLTLATTGVLPLSSGLVILTYNSSAGAFGANWTPAVTTAGPLAQQLYGLSLSNAPYTTFVAAGRLYLPSGPTYNQTTAPGTALKVMVSALWK
jgi:hypothetical protein